MKFQFLVVAICLTAILQGSAFADQKQVTRKPASKMICGDLINLEITTEYSRKGVTAAKTSAYIQVPDCPEKPDQCSATRSWYRVEGVDNSKVLSKVLSQGGGVCLDGASEDNPQYNTVSSRPAIWK